MLTGASQICWPWNDPYKDAPSGKYRKHTISLDDSGNETDASAIDLHREKCLLNADVC